MVTKKDDLVMSHVKLDNDTRIQMIQLLNQQLADGIDLHSQLKQAHWNVKGSNFIGIHELLDEIAEHVLENTDKIAERATALGGVAQGTARISAKNSRLPEIAIEALPSPEAIKMVVERMGAYATTTREAIDTADEADDIGTSDLFTEIVRELDQHIYFLDSHLN